MHPKFAKSDAKIDGAIIDLTIVLEIVLFNLLVVENVETEIPKKIKWCAPCCFYCSCNFLEQFSQERMREVVKGGEGYSGSTIGGIHRVSLCDEPTVQTWRICDPDLGGVSTQNTMKIHDLRNYGDKSSKKLWR